MTFEQLRIFVGVAEREHMTRAAEALNVTQSAASAAIAALEARHDVPLFHRVGRGIELTEAGRMFLEEARAVLGRAASAELALSEFGGLKRGTLRISRARPSPAIGCHRASLNSIVAIRSSPSNWRSTTPMAPPRRCSTGALNSASSKARSTSRHWRTGRSARIGWCWSARSLSMM